MALTRLSGAFLGGDDPLHIRGEPRLVAAARWVAVREQFEKSCRPEVGQLLRVLAGSVRDGIVGEIGTGCGVGAAWLLSGLRPEVPLLTVESDGRLAARVAELFREHKHARVIRGDWREILAYAPFALLFVDVAEAKEEGASSVIEALRTGGVAVLDDLTPMELWTDEQRERWAVDPVRVRWLEDPRLIATEIRVRHDHSVIVATRK